jgi:hypothetical protein
MLQPAEIGLYYNKPERIRHLRILGIDDVEMCEGEMHAIFFVIVPDGDNITRYFIIPSIGVAMVRGSAAFAQARRTLKDEKRPNGIIDKDEFLSSIERTAQSV